MNEEVTRALQVSLALHWMAAETYAAQAAHFARWGYAKLDEAAAADAAEEREHAGRLLARLEFYDVPPEMAHAVASWPRHDMQGILSANLAMERQAAEVERAAVLACREAGDEVTAAVFAENLDGSEAAVREITAALKVIAQIGLDNWLSAKV